MQKAAATALFFILPGGLVSSRPTPAQATNAQIMGLARETLGKPLCASPEEPGSKNLVMVCGLDSVSVANVSDLIKRRPAAEKTETVTIMFQKHPDHSSVVHATLWKADASKLAKLNEYAKNNHLDLRVFPDPVPQMRVTSGQPMTVSISTAAVNKFTAEKLASDMDKALGHSKVPTPRSI